jgi:hypothetical protein
MSDPSFSSVHLRAQLRRDDFRRARQQLLDACGELTQIAEKTGLGPPIMNHSMAPRSPETNRFLADSGYLLVDGELVYPLKIGINTIGRFLDSDVFLCEQAISRRHCVVLVHTTGACDLHDTASRNGTLLNGRRITQPMPLRSGDRIRLCNREFTFLSLADFQIKRVTAVEHDTMSE